MTGGKDETGQVERGKLIEVHDNVIWVDICVIEIERIYFHLQERVTTKPNE